MRVGVIIGSVRDGRSGEAVARWVHAAGAARTEAAFELIDLKQFDVPILTSSVVPGAANGQYDHPGVSAWSAAVDACDGFIFVTPEYNHSVPGALKNAFDSLAPEWRGKAVGFVSYGADGGIRAVEHWRTIVANFHMVAIRNQVALGLFTDFDDGVFAPLPRRTGELERVLDDLIAAVGARPA